MVDEAALEPASCLPVGTGPLDEMEYQALTQAVVRFLRRQSRETRAATGTRTEWRTLPAAWAGASAKLKAVYSAPETSCAVN